VDVSHLHEAHLNHLEEKLMPQTNSLEANIWFTAKLTDTIEKKFHSVVHHHNNVVKSPHLVHCLTIDEILNHTLTPAKKCILVSFVNYASDLFKVEVKIVVIFK
jgi:hypothetical protein